MPPAPGERPEGVADTLLGGTDVGKPKTHCKRGHEFTPENTYVVPKTGTRRCKACQRERNRRYGEAHPERVRKQSRQWYLHYQERHKEYARQYRLANPEQTRAAVERWRDENPVLYRYSYHENYRRIHTRLRQAVLDAYGHICGHCGETDESVLQIDHVNEDGPRHRAQIGGSGLPTYRWLEKNGFPEGFQTLCRACNSKKAAEHRRHGKAGEGNRHNR